MYELIATVTVFISAGYALRRLQLVRTEAAVDLNVLVFNVTLPALVFVALHRAALSPSMLLLPAIAMVTSLAGALGAWGLGRCLRLQKPLLGALILACAFGNTTYLGYPVVQGFFGDTALTLAVLYDLVGATVAINTVGILASAHFGTTHTVTAADSLRRLALYPAIWAMVAGLALHSVQIPPLIEHVAERVGQATSPLIMFSIGMSLRGSTLRQNWRLVGLATLLRVAVLPAVVLGVLLATGLRYDYIQVCVLQAAMPAMFSSLTLALVFGLDKVFAVNAIMVSTVVSFVTLPLWYVILGLFGR